MNSKQSIEMYQMKENDRFSRFERTNLVIFFLQGKKSKTEQSRRSHCEYSDVRKLAKRERDTQSSNIELGHKTSWQCGVLATADTLLLRLWQLTHLCARQPTDPNREKTNTRTHTHTQFFVEAQRNDPSMDP